VSVATFMNQRSRKLYSYNFQTVVLIVQRRNNHMDFLYVPVFVRVVCACACMYISVIGHCTVSLRGAFAHEVV